MTAEFPPMFCRLEKYSGFLDFADDSDFIGYEIEGNKAILHLNACIMRMAIPKEHCQLRGCIDKVFIRRYSLDFRLAQFHEIFSGLRIHKTSLRYLFGAQKEYDVTFMVDGESMVKPCRLEKYSGFLDFADDSDFRTLP